MPVTLKDVAARAGVSPSAVSRTFTDGASVSDKMRRKVEKAASELGYRPSALAAALTTGRTKLIGLVSNNFQNPIFLEVFDRFTRALQDCGLRPLLVNLTDETAPDASVRLLQQYSVDGVIVASSTLPPGFAHAFRDAGMPVVHAFGRNEAKPGVDVVGIDNMACGRIVAETLLARGYKDIAFLGGPRDATSTRDRFAGFQAIIRGQKDVSFTVSYAENYTFDAGRTEMLRLLKDKPAEVYFCGDDVLSIGALSALQSAGLRVPQDVGVIGFNNMEMAGWQNIDLTTVHQPLDEIIETSVEIMHSLLTTSGHAPKVRMFPCTVVERSTLRPLA